MLWATARWNSSVFKSRQGSSICGSRRLDDCLTIWSHLLRLLETLRQVVGADQVLELGEARVELQFDNAGGAVALLADDHLGHTMHLAHAVLPFLMLGGVGAGLGAAQIIFLAVDEQHDVG